jgi:hypothetical protein
MTEIFISISLVSMILAVLSAMHENAKLKRQNDYYRTKFAAESIRAEKPRKFRIIIENNIIYVQSINGKIVLESIEHISAHACRKTARSLSESSGWEVIRA